MSKNIIQCIKCHDDIATFFECFNMTTDAVSFDCQTCGACCAYFRVSFYWAETDAHPLGQVPQALTKPISPYRVAMQGSTSSSPRCVALAGDIGQSVGCTIYEKRSSPCREFEMGSEGCFKARKAHGLPV